jgi:hypothetical protein
MEEEGPLDGGHARGELLRGIGFDSYDARRAVAAFGELLQACAGRFDLARSCFFWCGRSADGIDPPSKVRNLTNRCSCRLRWSSGLKECRCRGWLRVADSAAQLNSMLDFPKMNQIEPKMPPRKWKAYSGFWPIGLFVSKT